jgi:hypothetical protein
MSDIKVPGNVTPTKERSLLSKSYTKNKTIRKHPSGRRHCNGPKEYTAYAIDASQSHKDIGLQ